MLAHIIPHVITQLVLLFVIYILVAVAIFLDLWAGVRKAKARGEFRSSTGLRKTVAKFCSYYNMLLAITVIDILQMLVVGLLDFEYGYTVPVIPITTAAGACFIGFIEVKSIFEKNADKERAKVQAAANDLQKLIKDDGAKDILSAALAIIQDNRPKEGQQDGTNT